MPVGGAFMNCSVGGYGDMCIVYQDLSMGLPHRVVILHEEQRLQ